MKRNLLGLRFGIRKHLGWKRLGDCYPVRSIL
jgi:hypothetical protein